MKRYLYSLEAVAGILTESFRVTGNRETGGVLVGPINHSNIITDIIPSTESAERGYATYYQSPSDVKRLNKVLLEYQKNNYDFKGYFHKHPSGMKYLSSGDLLTCRMIFAEPNYHINNQLIMVIVSATQSQDFPIFNYEVSLESQNINVEETEITTLPKSCILECMQCFELPEERKHNGNINTRYNNRRNEGEDEFHFIRDSDRIENDTELSVTKTRVKKNSILLSGPKKHTGTRKPGDSSK